LFDSGTRWDDSLPCDLRLMREMVFSIIFQITKIIYDIVNQYNTWIVSKNFLPGLLTSVCLQAETVPDAVLPHAQ